MVICHCLYNGIRKPPQTQEVRANLRMMRFHPEDRLPDSRRRIIRCSCGPRGEHHFAHVMQHSRKKRLLGSGVAKLLMECHRTGHHCGVEAVLPELLQTEPWNAGC